MGRTYIGPMLQIRLTPTTIERLDAIAAAAGIPRVEVIRTLVDAALDAGWVVE